MFYSETNLCQWDCYHYLRIALEGYSAPPNSDWGYFPLFPLLVRIVSHITPGSILVTGYIINNALSFLSFFLLGKILFQDESEYFRKFFYFILCFSPATVYFITFYSESLFLFLLVLLIHSLKELKYHYCILILGIIPLARGNGYFVIASLILSHLPKVARRFLTGNYRYLIFATVPILSLFSYGFYYLAEPFFLFQGSSMFAAIRHPNFSWIQSAFMMSSITNLVNLAVVLFSLFCCYKLKQKKYLFEFWLLLITTLIASVTIINFRYILGIYPTYVVLAKLSSANRYVVRGFAVVYLATFLVLESFWLSGMKFMV